MKKICNCCGRNRKIGKFGRRSDYSDGKNPICRDCMRDKRYRYSCTLVGREKKHKTIKKWKSENKDHIREYNKKYYKLNRERILFNKKSRESTESILNEEKTDKIKINKGKKVNITINPKRV